jgi:replication-associated recombination protein RarA
MTGAESRVERCIQAMLESPKSFQHTIFVGPPGCGKTTAAWNIVNHFYKTPLERVGRTLFLNASDERSLEAIRSKVYPFAESAGSGLFGYTEFPKIIIFDEVETLTEPAQLALRPLLEKPTSDILVFFLCNSLSKIHPALRSRFFVLRFDPLPEDLLKSRLALIKPEAKEPGRYDIRVRRSDLRYFLLNPQNSQDATEWLVRLLVAHPSQRQVIWEKTYETTSIQTFGCLLLTLSSMTGTGISNWESWGKFCDPNLVPHMSKDAAIATMEKIWAEFEAATQAT